MVGGGGGGGKSDGGDSSIVITIPIPEEADWERLVSDVCIRESCSGGGGGGTRNFEYVRHEDVAGVITFRVFSRERQYGIKRRFIVRKTAPGSLEAQTPPPPQSIAHVPAIPPTMVRLCNAISKEGRSRRGPGDSESLPPPPSPPRPQTAVHF